MGASISPLPVLCLSVGTALGGSERCLLDFAALAPELGLRPTVLVPRDGQLREALVARGVSVRVAPAPDDLLDQSQQPGTAVDAVAFGAGLIAWSRAISREAEHVEGGERALLYSNGYKAHLATLLFPLRRRVWHLHEFPPERAGLAWKLALKAGPHGAIANSFAVAEAWGVGATVVHNGVDTTLFRPAPRTGWLHEQLGIPGAARLIGMPAAFARWKGQLLVTEAFERIAPEQRGVHLAIIGGPIYDTKAERGYAEELVRRVGRSEVRERIHFVKFQTEPWRLYPELDVAIHASTKPEPFGRVIVEAMASGTPIIASDAGGPREILEPGRTGWLVKPDDADALAAALREVLDPAHAARRIAIVEAARQVATERFGVQRFAAGVAAVIRRAADPTAR